MPLISQKILDTQYCLIYRAKKTLQIRYSSTHCVQPKMWDTISPMGDGIGGEDSITIFGTHQLNAAPALPSMPSDAIWLVRMSMRMFGASFGKFRARRRLGLPPVRGSCCRAFRRVSSIHSPPATIRGPLGRCAGGSAHYEAMPIPSV